MSLDDPTPLAHGCLEEVTTQNLWSVPPPPTPHAQVRTSLRSVLQSQRLNGKAIAFQPQMVPEAVEPQEERYKSHIADALRSAKVAIQESDDVVNVEISEHAGGWSLIIQPTGNGEDLQQNQILMSLAQEALLDAAASSKCVYVMGYAGPKPFDMRAQGFQATLGAMRSAKTACWHVFKKGFCRHDVDCVKQHPACQVPIHVLVEGVQLNSCARFSSAFKQVVADFALTITSSLEENSHVEKVVAFKDKDRPGWTIEMTAKEDSELAVYTEDYLLTLAKNAIFGACSNNDMLYIMGYATKPFTSKEHGFVTVLGDMQDESRVCWDLYSKGCCTRDGQCRWEHPECLMPMNVVVKEKTSCSTLPISLHSAMQQQQQIIS